MNLTEALYSRGLTILARQVEAAFKPKAGSAVKVQFGDEVLTGVITEIKKKQAKVELDNGTLGIFPLEDLEEKEEEITDTLKLKIKDWDRLYNKVTVAQREVKKMAAQMSGLENYIIPELEKLENTMARIDKAVFMVERKETQARPYKKAFEQLLQKVSKKLANESYKELERMKKEGAKINKKLKKIQGQKVSAIKLPSWLQKFFNKVKGIAKKIKGFIKKSEPDIREMEKIVAKLD